jgi:hypothetical protein
MKNGNKGPIVVPKEYLAKIDEYATRTARKKSQVASLCLEYFFCRDESRRSEIERMLPSGEIKS